eukprot:12611792-Alexandrium_andersonii.AAC.1
MFRAVSIQPGTARNCSELFRAVSNDFERCRAVPGAFGQFRAKSETARNSHKLHGQLPETARSCPK